MVDKKIKIFCDGGSRGNPGHSAAGVVFMSTDGKIIHKYHKYLGIQTNNYAEYQAVLLALDNINDYKSYNIEFYLDSMLIVKQLNGEYRVKNANLRPIYQEIINKIAGLNISFEHIYREDNTLADAQVNICLDNHSM